MGYTVHGRKESDMTGRLSTCLLYIQELPRESEVLPLTSKAIIFKILSSEKNNRRKSLGEGKPILAGYHQNTVKKCVIVCRFKSGLLH